MHGVFTLTRCRPGKFFSRAQDTCVCKGKWNAEGRIRRKATTSCPTLPSTIEPTVDIHHTESNAEIRPQSPGLQRRSKGLISGRHSGSFIGSLLVALNTLRQLRRSFQAVQTHGTARATFQATPHDASQESSSSTSPLLILYDPFGRDKYRDTTARATFQALPHYAAPDASTIDMSLASLRPVRPW